MADKLPFMPFYGADFYESESVGLMDATEEGVYLRLLWRQWREGSLPADPADLERLVRAPISERVLACFPVREDGRRRNTRLEEIRELHLKTSERLSEAGRRGRAKQLAAAKSGPRPGRVRARPKPSPEQAQTELGESEPESDTETDTTTTSSAADAAAPKPRETWITPFEAAWVAQYGGKPTIGQLLKHLAPVRAELGEADALARWTRYLAATKADYASAAKFAAIHGTYAASPIVQMTDDFGIERPHRRRADGRWDVQRDGEWMHAPYLDGVEIKA